MPSFTLVFSLVCGLVCILVTWAWRLWDRRPRWLLALALATLVAIVVLAIFWPDWPSRVRRWLWYG